MWPEQPPGWPPPAASPPPPPAAAPAGPSRANGVLWTCVGWVVVGGGAGVLAWLALGPVDHGDSVVSDPNSLTEFYAVVRPWLLLGPIAAGVALRLTGHRRPLVTAMVLWLVGTVASVPVAIVVALLVTLKLGGTAVVAFAALWLVPPPVIARLASTVQQRNPSRGGGRSGGPVTGTLAP